MDQRNLVSAKDIQGHWGTRLKPIVETHTCDRIALRSQGNSQSLFTGKLKKILFTAWSLTINHSKSSSLIGYHSNFKLYNQ